MVNIIPIQSTIALNSMWPTLIEGFQSILRHSEGDCSLESIYSDALSAVMTINIVQVDGTYAGFFTTAVSQKPNAKKCMMIYFMYLKPGTPLETMGECLQWTRKLMRELKCTQLQFYTTREKAFDKRMGPMGFKAGYRQFIFEEE